MSHKRKRDEAGAGSDKSGESKTEKKAAPAASDGSFDVIKFEDQPFELQFHPTRQLVAAGLVTGHVFVHSYTLPSLLGPISIGAPPKGTPENPKEQRMVFKLTHHESSCRTVEFSADGAHLLTGSSDKSIALVDMASGELACQIMDAHNVPVNVVRTYDGQMFCSGDDEGGVKIWDVRQKSSAVQRWAVLENADFISDMAALRDKKQLLATSGDGTLAVYDMRKGTLFASSDQLEDDLLSIAILKDGNKIVCGSREGALDIFTWDYFGQPDDRFLGHPQSVESIAKIDEDTVCTASSDGLIRIVQIHPHLLLGVVGAHEDFPVECVRLAADKEVLGSASHDNTVKLWDVRFMFDESGEGDEAEEDAEEKGGGDDSDGEAAEPPTKRARTDASAAASATAAADDDDAETGAGAGSGAASGSGKAAAAEGAVESKKPAKKTGKKQQGSESNEDTSDSDDGDAAAAKPAAKGKGKPAPKKAQSKPTVGLGGFRAPGAGKKAASFFDDL